MFPEPLSEFTAIFIIPSHLMLSGTNHKDARAHNARIVLEMIRLNQPISRASIARQTDLTPQTVSNIVKLLLERNLISEGQRVQEGRGAPATTLILNERGAYSIGIDLDQDHMTAVLVDLGGAMVGREFHRLDFPSPEVAVNLMCRSSTSLINRHGIDLDDILGLGIALPGPLAVSDGSTVTNLVRPKAFPGWESVPIVDLVEEQLHIPVFLKNNATAAAIGEAWHGVGKDANSFFYVFFGLGLGGGLIIDGHPHEGFSGNAGEIGYLPTPRHSLEAESGVQHEGYFFNLPRLYAELESHGFLTSSPEDLLPLFEARETPLMNWLDNGVSHLAPIILAVEYIVDPEAIVYGGRLPYPILDYLKEELQKRLPTLRIPEKPTGPSQQLATSIKDAVAKGVASIPVYESFSPGSRGFTAKRNNDVLGTI